VSDAANQLAELDLGSGVGGLIPDLTRAFPDARIVAVDRSPGMLRSSEHTFPKAIMDATRLALSSDSMDLVVMVFVLFHVAEPEEALAEIRRVLRPGGCVGCITWGQELESQASRLWTECLNGHGAAEADSAIVTRHDRFNSPDKMKQLFEEAGFSHVRSWEEDLAPMIDKEHLLRLRTQMGSSKPRFDSLPEPIQADCLAEATRQMELLTPDDFVARGKTVHTMASA
jgi:ubiquinone/menaquinone biosynthesis C-methylase UbiE